MKPTKNSYEIYITNSSEAGYLIHCGLLNSTPWSKAGGERISTSTGYISDDSRIPPMYHNSGKFYAMIEYRNGKDWDHPEYRIIIC